MKPTSSAKSINSLEKKAIPVVAIGSSAGGLAAMSELLQNLSPTTGLAFVYIPHLSSTYKSQLVHILGRLTNMPVLQAQHQLAVEANHLYIIPPDNDLEIVDGRLSLLPRRVHPHMPIDQFFVSLANRQKDRAIGVVLSGMDGDGTLGLKAIKVAGGISLVQDNSALYTDMPHSAVAEGVVDKVLSPRDIAYEINRISQKSAIFQQTSLAERTDEDTLLDQELTPVIQLVSQHMGVDLCQYKPQMIRQRIMRRMRLSNQQTMTAYLHYLKAHDPEVLLLYNDLLSTVTTFFWDRKTMAYLKNVLFPQLIKCNDSRRTLRIWVPACSTGQEVYSLAILAGEVLGSRLWRKSIRILATDLNEPAIAKARQGSYTGFELEGVSSRRLTKYFFLEKGQYQINQTVRGFCQFSQHNLFQDIPFAKLDMICCRNLLAELRADFQLNLLVRFHQALIPGGFLLVGQHETIPSLTTLFTAVDEKHTVYVRNDVLTSQAHNLG